jgi:hypothetical protein
VPFLVPIFLLLVAEEVVRLVLVLKQLVAEVLVDI